LLLVFERTFDYGGGMTSTRQPGGDADAGMPPARGDIAARDETPGTFGDPVTAEGVERLSAAVHAVSARETWRLPDADLAALLQRLEVERRRLLMVQIAVAVEARKRGLPRQAGFGPGRGVKGGDTAALAGWVRSLVNVSRGDARHLAEVGAALFTDPVAADLGETRAAALTGQVTSRHVMAIAEAVTELAPPFTPVDPRTGAPAVDEATRRDAQRVLAAHAAVLDPVQTRVLAKRTVAVLDPGSGERLAKDEDARAARRGLWFTPDGSGLVHLRGTLTPTCAGLLAPAIDAASAPRAAADGTPDSRPAAQRRHDGLQHVLGQVVAADGLLPSTHGSPYRLVVTVPHATLTAALTGDGDRAASADGQRPSPVFSPGAIGQKHGELGGRSAEAALPGVLPDGFPLSPLTVQTLACSADLVPVLVDDDHQPLDVGDTQYAFPPKVRTANITRDKACTYPGCAAPAPWCDCHHLIKFADGGATSVTNGALLCGRHHRYVHALNLTGRVTTRDGMSHVQWDHRPTSWTATTATTATGRRDPATGSRHPATGTDRDDHDDPDRRDAPPALTDRCLDQLLQRWQRRRQATHHDQSHAA
jgi:hypothetical protein